MVGAREGGGRGTGGYKQGKRRIQWDRERYIDRLNSMRGDVGIGRDKRARNRDSNAGVHGK